MRLLLTVLAAALLAQPGLAVDRCLVGGSLLGDQRALADVRATTEVRCPCASFDGAPGRNRAAYQGCALAAVYAAMATAALRPACKSTATRTYKRSTCGTLNVACARFKPTARTPVSCRVKPAIRCRDGTTFQERACLGETHCADVIDSTAGTCMDVRAPGPFATGVRVVRFTKPSVTDPAQERVLDTVVWYPAPPASGPVDSAYGAVLDAPLDVSGGPYPLVLFSHGSCGRPTQSTFLWPLVASHGFVVAAPPHPGNTLAEFPACGTQAALIASAFERPADVRFVLDGMLAANADPGSPFLGALDAGRIAMAGHSFGGATTYVVAGQDARIRVALPLAPAVLGTPALAVPSLTMLGQVDTYVSNDAIRAAYQRAQPPKYLVELRATGHFAFSDLCFPSADCSPPVTTTQAEAHAEVVRWVVPFLLRHLRGEGSWAPFLVPPAGPGAVLSATH